MRRSPTVFACVAVTLASSVALAQQTVPVVDLAAASARSAESFGAILGVRQLPFGKLLVNDGGRRRVTLFDSTLTHPSIVIDSTAGLANSYGARGAPLIPYLGDSSLFVDNASQSFVVIDPKGQVARVMAAPRPQDLLAISGAGQSGIDSKGRLLYRGPMSMTRSMNTGGAPAVPSTGPAAPMSPPDSAPILRADFDTRSVDTVGRIKQQSGMKITPPTFVDGKPGPMTMTINPLQTVDEWAVLSDGSVAFVRGHDYHVDYLRPDGSTSSSAKLPFDWKRLTDEDKQKLIDSARTAQTKQTADAKAALASGAAPGAGGRGAGGDGAPVMQFNVVMGVGGGGGMGGGGGPPPAMAGGSTVIGPDGVGRNVMQGAITPDIDFVPLKEIADYYPPIRSGAAKADMDGNLWILPTTSAQSLHGELVYDVVNRTGDLVRRVRIPAGRSVVGFGKGGVVYLVSGDRTNGFYLEKTRLLVPGKTTQ